MEFKEWFAAELKRRTMSDRQFALYAKVSPHAPRTWRLGSSRPSYENCAVIAHVFRVESSFVRRLVGYAGDDAAHEPQLSPDEFDLVSVWRQAGADGRRLLQLAARAVREGGAQPYEPRGADVDPADTR